MWIILGVLGLGCGVLLRESFVSFVPARRRGCTGWRGARTDIQKASTASGARAIALRGMWLQYNIFTRTALNWYHNEYSHVFI